MTRLPRITLRPGVVLNTRTAAMHSELERRLGVHLPVTQGSYNAGGVSASAGTHDGGGAEDVPPGVPGATAARIVLEARRVGFAAWHRLELWTTTADGKRVRVWPEHVHMIAIGDPEMSTGAHNQVLAYIAGFNGLGHLGRGGPDDGPRVAPWHRWPLMRRIAAVRVAEKSARAARLDLEKWRREHATP